MTNCNMQIMGKRRVLTVVMFPQFVFGDLKAANDVIPTDDIFVVNVECGFSKSTRKMEGVVLAPNRVQTLPNRLCPMTTIKEVSYA